MAKMKFTDQQFLELYNKGYYDVEIAHAFNANPATVTRRRWKLDLLPNYRIVINTVTNPKQHLEETLRQYAIAGLATSHLYEKEHKEQRRKYAAEHKEYHREYHRKWYQQYADQIQEQHKKYYREHRNQVREHQRNYGQTHKEQTNATHRKYYAQHKEQNRERNRKYHEQHKEQIRERKRKYRLARILPPL